MMGFLDARRQYAPRLPHLDDDHVTRALMASALFLVAFFIATIPAWLTDPRMLDGVNVWTKPQKFAVSLAVHFLTLAILAQQLPRNVRAGPSMSLFTYLAMASMLFEQVYIAIQAARARRSHFNFETELEMGLYSLMGLGALLLVFVAVVLAIQIWRKGERNLQGFRLGSIIGLIAGAAATLGFAGYMSMSGSHWIGEHPPGGASVPFFGWSLETGDLRPAHFVALHMMQSLPIIGYAVDKIGGPSRLAVLIGAAIQLALAAWLFMQALAGNPFWPI